MYVYVHGVGECVQHALYVTLDGSNSAAPSRTSHERKRDRERAPIQEHDVDVEYIWIMDMFPGWVKALLSKPPPRADLIDYLLFVVLFTVCYASICIVSLRRALQGAEPLGIVPPPSDLRSRHREWDDALRLRVRWIRRRGGHGRPDRCCADFRRVDKL